MDWLQGWKSPAACAAAASCAVAFGLGSAGVVPTLVAGALALVAAAGIAWGVTGDGSIASRRLLVVPLWVRGIAVALLCLPVGCAVALVTSAEDFPRSILMLAAFAPMFGFGFWMLAAERASKTGAGPGG